MIIIENRGCFDGIGHRDLKITGAVIKTWRRRWFVLKGSRLYWFKESDVTPTSVPRGVIHLDDFYSAKRVAADEPHSQHQPHTLELSGHDSTLQLVADSKKDMEIWINRINDVLKVFEAETITARYYSRLQNGSQIIASLFRMGRRAAPAKSSFKMMSGSQNACILTLIEHRKSCPLTSLQKSETAQKYFRKLVTALRHPYLWPVLAVDYVGDKRRAVVVRPYAANGSLRDKLYNITDPTKDYPVKYSEKRPARIPEPEIRVYGRQILEAMLYLTDRKFQVAHLHAGNVLVEGKKCCLTDVIENELMGVPVECEVDEHITVKAFGRLLHEISTGVPMSGDICPSLTPGRESRQLPSPAIMQILNAIFGSAAQKPTIKVTIYMQFLFFWTSRPSFASASNSSDINYFAMNRLWSLQDVASTPLFGNLPLVADVRFINQDPLEAKCQTLLKQMAAKAVSREGEEECEAYAVISPDDHFSDPAFEHASPSIQRNSSAVPSGTGADRADRLQRKSRAKTSRRKSSSTQSLESSKKESDDKPVSDDVAKVTFRSSRLKTRRVTFSFCVYTRILICVFGVFKKSQSNAPSSSDAASPAVMPPPPSPPPGNLETTPPPPSGMPQLDNKGAGDRSQLFADIRKGTALTSR